MKYQLSRRKFITNLVLIGTGTGFAKTVSAQSDSRSAVQLPSPTADSKGLTFNQAGYDVWIRWNNELIACYRAHPTQKYPYIYPLIGLASGRSLTTETALPWHHHRSIFFGCDRVNGDDYWSQELDKGKIISSKPKVVELTEKSLQIYDNCQWRSSKNELTMSDARKITFTINSDQFYFVDWEIVWSALNDVAIQKTNHSLFALRAAPDITPSNGGSLLNANGESGEKQTFGKKSDWCAFYGKRKNSNITEGIALFDHPKNPWYPTPWFTRDYGFISPTPLNFIEKPLIINKGTSLKLKYRIVAFIGSPQQVDLQKLFKDWSNA